MTVFLMISGLRFIPIDNDLFRASFSDHFCGNGCTLDDWRSDLHGFILYSQHLIKDDFLSGFCTKFFNGNDIAL